MQFVVIGRDGTDPDAPARRQKARPHHLAKGDQLRDAGNLWFGAALLSENAAGEKTMTGSVYIVDFDTHADLDAWLAEEPYMVGGVWQDVEIIPANVNNPQQFSHPADYFDGRTEH